MTQVEKHIWLIETIRRAGKISLRELSEEWVRHTDLSYGQPLQRATLNRWRDAILMQFGIVIDCQRKGGYRYYIANPEVIESDKLKNWLFDTLTVGKLIGDNLALHDRILADPIPSARRFLAMVLGAMKDNRVLHIHYHSFVMTEAKSFDIEPYSLKLFENRWYLLAKNVSMQKMRCYALDRIEELCVTERHFVLPNDFSAESYYAHFFGIVTDDDIKPERVVIRAYDTHQSYMKTLSLHDSQRLMRETDDYADFELYLSPTYDFVMRLLHTGPFIEVLEPASLRRTMKEWITKMALLFLVE